MSIDEAGPIGREVAVDHGRVVAVGHEADLLAVRLVRDTQAPRERDPPDVVFRHLTDREQRARELRLGQGEEEIRLVLAMVDAAQQVIDAPGVARHAGIVAGRHTSALNPAACSTSVENLSSLLQCAHGMGVRPPAYSRTKFATTTASNRRSRFTM